jgi:hypothetical protein
MSESEKLGSEPSISSRKRNILIFVLIGVTSIFIRLLYSYEFETSALLYVGIPFFVAIALLAILKKPQHDTLGSYYVYASKWSFIVMLGTSIILFEGFVCVVIFMPIYFFILFLMYLFHTMVQRLHEKKKNTLHAHTLPVLIVVSALEGVVPSFEFDREYSVSRDILIDAPAEAIQAQLKQPMELDVDRNWLLSLFPMPTDIEAGSLSSGDVHNIKFVYHRWFVTNTHSGAMSLELTEVSEDYIKTTFLEDTSYISNYMDLKGTEIRFEERDNEQTKVTLTIHYTRFLDPVWYFGPLQEYAIGKTAELLLSELFVPNSIQDV